jgi:FkbM family methyltransferase
MNILIYGTIIGPGGIAHHTREFTKRLAKLHNVKFINFNVPKVWDGVYSTDMYKNLSELDDIHHQILHMQTLWSEDGGGYKLKEFPLSGYDSEFKPDIHLVMAEANHHYHYKPFHKLKEPAIAYFPWETDRVRDDFFNELLKFDRIWVPSEWQRGVLVNQGYDSAKIDVVPEGVDSLIYNPNIPTKKNEKFTFLHIGTWEYRKSTYEIVKNFIDLYGDDDNVELRLSISNKFREQDDEVTTFNKFGIPIKNNIKFLPTLTETEYINEIKSANVYLSCARGEGWNLPLIQSMASGIPSIWSKVGGQLEFANGAELGCDYVYEFPVTTVRYINDNPWYWEWGQGFPGNLYEPDFSQLKSYMVEVYNNYDFYKSQSITFSETIRKNFDWGGGVDIAINLMQDLLKNNSYKKYVYSKLSSSNLYYLIHSNSFGDTLASTPTLRYLSHSHNNKINVVTHNKSVFINNPYIAKIITFDEYDKLNLPSDSVIYQSFTSAGRQDERGVEKKFGHIDIRQLHAMDLGFQLVPENMHYDYYPNSFELPDVNLPERYVVLHITNNWANRTWDYNNWYNLIQWLSDNRVFTILIGNGHRETVHHSISDVPLEKQCPSFDNLYGLDLTNQGTMSDMWYVINGAQCIVTMDTGPLHLAGTTDTHIIQLGSAVHPSLRAPYRNGSQNYKYNYISGECNLFCNSNLRYNVKEWGDINAVPPQTGCLEGYGEFRCHPKVHSVWELIKTILPDKSNILTDTKWDGVVFSYNFNTELDKPANIILRDLITGFKIHSTYHTEIKPVDTSYWIGIGYNIYMDRSVVLELYIDGNLVETSQIEVNNNFNYKIKDVSITSNLFEKFNVSENVFGTYYEVFIKNVYSKYNVDVSVGDVVLDIGANHGFFSLYSLYKGASKVISVEPINVCYSNLHKLSKKFPSIIPMNYAVLDRDGLVEFGLDENFTAGSFVLGINYISQHSTTNTISVNAIHINDLLDKVGHIDFLKVDCEGAEYNIFNSIDDSKLINIPKIIIEAHTTDIKDFIQEKLQSIGYSVHIDYTSEDIYMMYCKLNVF